MPQILCKLKGIINANDLLIVYKTLVQPHIDYCITGGGGGGDTGCGMWDYRGEKCGKWNFHFNVGLAIFVEIICVFDIKWFCLVRTLHISSD